MMTLEHKIHKLHKEQDAKEGKWSLTLVRDVKDEIRLISWTSKEELQTGTKLVVGTTFVCGFGIYIVDLTIKGGLEILRALFHFIFG